MVELLEVTTVFVVMLLALAAASALHWLLLHAAFRLMQPATARRPFPAEPRGGRNADSRAPVRRESPLRRQTCSF